ARAARGSAVVGICGGYQMLGERISDPEGVEGGGDSAGLGLLPSRVVFSRKKETWQARARVSGRVPWLDACPELAGYEIHAGQAASDRPLLQIRRPDGETVADGAFSPDGRTWGTHLHGLFQNAPFRRQWLASLGWRPPVEVAGIAAPASPYDTLADVLETACDMGKLDRIIGL
ncbi:MAG TPA: cobyric acid synthase CobQ, partial [Anaerolineae bacterium]